MSEPSTDADAGSGAPSAERKDAGYRMIMERIFFEHWSAGVEEFEFVRSEIESAAQALEIKVPDNLGDVPYHFRYRGELPENVRSTQPAGSEWIIEGAGRARYRFRLVPFSRILPRDDLKTIGIPDATPEIIRAYALDDEQALLAIVRYNRLIDIFLGITTYSLQNHLRTTAKGVGQIEIDELYFGIDKHGAHYVVPVQAKGGNDRIGVVQVQQDITWCEQKLPGLRCRPISVQFMTGERVAMFELTVEHASVKVVEERHYRLIPASELDQDAIRTYRS